MRQQLLDGRSPAHFLRVVGKELSDRIGARKLALANQLSDRYLGERLVDRTDVESRANGVWHLAGAVGEAVSLVEHWNAVFRHEGDTREHFVSSKLREIAVERATHLVVGHRAVDWRRWHAISDGLWCLGTDVDGEVGDTGRRCLLELDGNHTRRSGGALDIQFERRVGTAARHSIQRDRAEIGVEALVLPLSLFDRVPFQQARRKPFLRERFPRFTAAAVDGLDDGVDQRADLRRCSGPDDLLCGQ